MISGKVDYRLLDHTADTGIEVTAGSLSELLERAAAAMFDVMVDLDTVAASGPAERVVAEGTEPETLLVAWLGELLSRAMAQDAVYCCFEVDRAERLASGAWRAEGWARGAPLEPETHRFRTEIKAVTYHGLALRRDAERLIARVIFDL